MRKSKASATKIRTSTISGACQSCTMPRMSAVALMLAVLEDDTFDDVGNILAGIGRFLKEFVDLFPLDDMDGVGAFLEEPGHTPAESGIAFVLETVNLQAGMQHLHRVFQA